MEVLQLDGVDYIKVSQVAKKLGYTSDYVGQLCRSGKVAAHLIGRSWYVNESDLRNHKTSKSRRSVVKTKKALRSSLDDPDLQSRIISINKKSQNFYTKSTDQDHSYSEDQTELMPILSEKKNTVKAEIAVKHVDAKSLKIKQEKLSYKLQATEKPKVVFSGSLAVTSAEEEAVEVTSDNLVEKTALSIKNPSISKLQDFHQQREAVTTQPSQAKSKITSVLAKKTKARRVHIQETHPGRVPIVVILVALFLATLVGLLLASVEQIGNFTNGTYATSYRLNVDVFFNILRLKI